MLHREFFRYHGTSFFVFGLLISFSSPICVTNGFLVKSASLTGISPTSGTTLKDPSQAAGLYEVLSGTELRAITTALEKDGRTVMNLGGFKGRFPLLTPQCISCVLCLISRCKAKMLSALQ